MSDIEEIPLIEVEITPTLVLEATVEQVEVTSEVTVTPEIEVSVIVPEIEVSIEMPGLLAEFEAIAICVQEDDSMFNQFLELGEDIETHRAVYLSNGLIYKASQDDIDKIAVIGILTEAGLAGQSKTVRTGGIYAYTGWNWDLSPGRKIYLGIDGSLTQTVPTTDYYLEIGYPIKTNSMMVDIEEPIKL